MPDGSPFTLHAAAGSTGAVITLGGELDLTNASALYRAFDGALARLRERPLATLVLDMAGVKFLDVAAARVIATAAQAWPGPRPIVIRDPSPIVRRLLEVSGLSAELRLEGAIPTNGDGAGPAPPDGQQAHAEAEPRQIA